MSFSRYQDLVIKLQCYVILLTEMSKTYSFFFLQFGVYAIMRFICTVSWNGWILRHHKRIAPCAVVNGSLKDKSIGFSSQGWLLNIVNVVFLIWRHFFLNLFYHAYKCTGLWLDIEEFSVKLCLLFEGLLFKFSCFFIMIMPKLGVSGLTSYNLFCELDYFSQYRCMNRVL